MDGDGSRDSIKQLSCFEIGIQKYKISDGCDGDKTNYQV